MKIESLHRKIAKSALHPKCPQAVKEAVQRIARHNARTLGISGMEAAAFAKREATR